MSVPLVLALALLASCKDAAPPAAGSATGSATGSAAPAPIADRVGAGPSLPTPSVPSGVTSPPPAAFADERRDERWAKATEADLRGLLADLPGAQRVAVECRTAQCMVTVTAGAGQATATAGELESALRGQVASLLFADGGGTPDTVVVYAQYRR